MYKLFPIDVITKNYGGIAYNEISDKDIYDSLNNGTYDKTIKGQYYGESHAKRIAGIVYKMQNNKWENHILAFFNSTKFPNVWNMYDGNYRLRAYLYDQRSQICNQYLNKNILVFLECQD